MNDLTLNFEPPAPPALRPSYPAAPDAIAIAGAVLDDVESAILVLDEQGVVRVWNDGATQCLGWERHEVVGRPLADLLDNDDDRARLLRELPRIHRSRIELNARNRDGSVTQVRLNCHRLEPGISPLSGIIVTVNDLREHERLKSQVVRADRLATIGLLASTVAHEVGSPLNVILGRAEMLAETLVDDPNARRQIDAIAAQIERISEVVSRLLTFSRDAGPGREDVSLNRVLEEAVALVEPRLRRQRVRLRTELQPDLPNILGNAGHFHQVFLNLIMNALDAMPDGGELSVRTSMCEGAAFMSQLKCNCVQIEVRDTGPGIPPENRKRVFEPFFTTKQDGKGTGLGLAIAEQIVGLYSGHIVLDSNPGEGTHFHISLPRNPRGEMP